MIDRALTPHPAAALHAAGASRDGRHPVSGHGRSGFVLRVTAAALAGALAGCEVENLAGDDFTVAYDEWLNKCAACHTPVAAGQVPGTESTLDFSSATKAKASLLGAAKGLTGNFAGCNDVPFVVAGKPEQSLLMAAIDADVRANFDLSAHAGCTGDAISDMTVKVGGPDAAAIAKVRAWIAAGAP